MLSLKFKILYLTYMGVVILRRLHIVMNQAYFKRFLTVCLPKMFTN